MRLARAGDEIAERARLSRLVVGVLLVAGATSLPEIVTDVSAALAGAPDLAIGDLFGSSMANMAILAVLDLVHRHRVWPSVEVGHSRVASVAIALIALALLGMLTPEGWQVGWLGLDSVAIAVAYVAAVAWVHRSPVSRFGGELMPVPTGWTRARRTPVRPAAIRFALAALVILVSAPVLARSGEQIAELTGVGQTFVGAAMLAVATSLPELVASLAAVRIGAYDLAVGNLFGSNAFNMFALVLVDLAYTGGPVLTAADPSQAVAATGAILLDGAGPGRPRARLRVPGASARAGRGGPAARLRRALVAVWVVAP